MRPASDVRSGIAMSGHFLSCIAVSDTNLRTHETRRYHVCRRVVVQEKKGQDIVIADLTEIDGSIAKDFIICQGGSPTKVEAIAGCVGDIGSKSLNEKPVSAAGFGNDQ